VVNVLAPTTTNLTTLLTDFLAACQELSGFAGQLTIEQTAGPSAVLDSFLQQIQQAVHLARQLLPVGHVGLAEQLLQTLALLGLYISNPDSSSSSSTTTTSPSSSSVAVTLGFDAAPKNSLRLIRKEFATREKLTDLEHKLDATRKKLVSLRRQRTNVSGTPTRKES
jgi:hypothetical protein